MPRNPDKTPCSAPDCRAWAMRGSDPPLCASHAGRTTGAGAPDGNQNRRTHGFYADALSRDELTGLLADAGALGLDSEIAGARIALHRVLAHLVAADPGLSPLDYARIASVVFHGARTVARLLRDNHALGGQPSSGLAALIEITMHELGQEWGVDLGPPPGPHAHPPGNGPNSAPAAQRQAPASPATAGAPSPPRRLNLEKNGPGEPDEPE